MEKYQTSGYEYLGIVVQVSSCMNGQSVICIIVRRISPRHELNMKSDPTLSPAEFRITLDPGMTLMKRVRFSSSKGFNTTTERELEYFEVYGEDYVDQIAESFNIEIEKEGLFASR